MEWPVTKTVHIDVVVDLSCPWGFIAKKHLEKAMSERPDLDVEVRWRPYQINPDLPEFGMDYREYLLRKFGSMNDVYDIRDHLCAAASTLGIALHFEKIDRAPNTLLAHQLVRFAARNGLESAMVDVIYNAYFTEGLNIGDKEILIMLARRLGIPSRQTAEALDQAGDRSMILKETAAARAMGLSNVPAFFFNRQKILCGASTPLNLLAIIEKMSIERPISKRDLAELFDVKALVDQD